MESYDGQATREFIHALANMPSGWAQSHLLDFFKELDLELELRNRHYRHRMLEAVATKMVEALGGEVDWHPCHFSDAEIDAQEIAQKWYHLGHEDGEEGMAPEPGSRKEWKDL